MINWSRFAEIVHGHQRFVLTSHVRPDADALGSELAMLGILEKLGKEVLICNAFPVPRNLKFLDADHQFKQLEADVPAAALEAYEVIIVLDTSAWIQLGAMADVLRTTKLLKVVLDHHVSGDDLGAEPFKNVEAEATGRIVVEAAHQLGVEMTPTIARPAFMAIATDTGWFRFSSASAGTFRMIATLVEAGAVPSEIYKALYERDTLARLQLIGRAIGRAQTDLNGRLIYSWIEQADFAATCAVPSDSEDIINMAMAVDGAEVAIMLVEQASGGFKVSLRSRNEFDCSRLAEQFGGGGHKKAAGAFLNGPLPAARENILDAVRAAME
jgi:bifunctional oligoribonuclease and PAP phosphatase NrnA